MKLDIRKGCAFIELPNGVEVYIDWSIEGETIVEYDKVEDKL